MPPSSRLIGLITHPPPPPPPPPPPAPPPPPPAPPPSSGELLTFNLRPNAQVLFDNISDWFSDFDCSVPRMPADILASWCKVLRTESITTHINVYYICVINFLHIGMRNQPFDIDKYVQHIVKDAFEECDTSQVWIIYMTIILMK